MAIILPCHGRDTGSTPVARFEDEGEDVSSPSSLVRRTHSLSYSTMNQNRKINLTILMNQEL